MPRKARQLSNSGIYHAMLRGINRQTIFEDNEDMMHFMNTLKICKELSGFELYSFCLMNNHVHLLLKTADEPLDLIFKRIGSRFVGWYNRKYQREGHLFQDRFRSENVETDAYFLTVLRYIIQNPVKAGIVAHPGTYRWSSYQAYNRGSGSVTDTEFALNMLGSRGQLISYLNETNDDTVMDEDQYEWRFPDEQAKKIMFQVSQCSSVSEYQLLDMPRKKEYAREMYLNKLTMGQISRLTGMAKTTIYKAINTMDPQSLSSRQSLKLHEAAFSPFQTEWDESCIPW